MEMGVEEVVAALRRKSSKRVRDGMVRYALPSEKALGVPVGDIRHLGKHIGPNHPLALEIWKTGIYEARLLSAFIADPARLTSAQMDRWARDFDNWGICDTLCFHLFKKTPHAWTKVAQWSAARREFVRRAAFALLASLALHDKTCPDEPFLRSLRFIERAANDQRNFVKKGVSWALRGIGRRNFALNAAATDLARTLSTSAESAARWVGNDALRELTSPAVQRRLEARSRAMRIALTKR